jgi:hypothetical protein
VTDARPQRWQRAQQRPLDLELRGGDGARLGVRRCVDFGAPLAGDVVPRRQIDHTVTTGVGDRNLAFRVADEVLDDALGLRIVRVAEVRSEPVVRREADVVRCRDHHVRDDPALQAAHPIGQDLARDAAEGLEALSEHRHRGRRGLVAGEAHEPHPTPRQHGAEHLDPAGQRAPVDDEGLARHPHRWPSLTGVRSTPRLLLAGHNPPEVPRRARVPGGACRRQQPLGRDPPSSGGDPLGDERSHTVGVLRHRRTLCPVLLQLARLVGDHDALHSLGVNTADLRGAPERADVSIRGNNIHSLPR